MADETHRGIVIALAKPQDRIEVGKVVRKPVAIQAAPCAATKATPVRGDHMPVVGKRIDDELEGRRRVHPAMQQVEPWQAVLAPFAQMEAQTADVSKAGTGNFHRRIITKHPRRHAAA